MPKILITGGAGYVGRNLVRQLADLKYEVIGVYRTNYLDYGSVDWVKCDLRKKLDALPPVDYVIHSSNLHPLREPSPNAVDYLEANVNVTLNLAHWSKKVGVRKFILLSTITTHGTITVPELTENSPQIAPDLYGLTKYLSERVLKVFGSSFAVCIFRLPGVIGPDIIDLGRPWLSLVLKNAVANDPIDIYNGNSLYNNFIDVEEIGRACVTVFESFDEKMGLFNLAASTPMPLRSAIRDIVIAVNSKSKIVETPTDRKSYYINTDCIKRELGFVPVSTAKILNRFVKNNL